MTAIDTKLEKPMPHTLEAERAVLGAILIEPKVIYRLGGLEASDFFRDSHRLIFRVMQQMAKTGSYIEPLALREELAAAGKLEEVGGIAYIADLIGVVPDITNIEQYVEWIVRKAQQRRLVAAGNAMMHAALEPDADPSAIAADAIAKLMPSATKEDAQARPLFEVISEQFKIAEERAVGGKGIVLRTRFDRLNSYECVRPTLIVVGSPSNHGKTAFVTELGTDIASFEQPTAAFSLESTVGEMAWRWVSSYTGIPHSRVSDFERADMREIVKAHQRAKNLPYYMTRRIRTIDGIYAELRRLKSVVGLKAATIDYFQLIGFPDGPRDREERLAMVSQRLLEYAIDLEVAIIVASQLNEDRKSRAGGRLHQSDLKYARAIGESARVVLLFQRPAADDKANKDLRSCEVLFQVEKHNEGRTGDYEMHFDEVTQRFGEGGCEENRCRHYSKADTETQTLWNG